MSYSLLKCLFFLITILGINHALVAAEAQNDLLEEQESEEYENALVQNLRNDYSSGFRGLVTLFDSINNTLVGLTTKLSNLETTVNINNQKWTEKIENLKTTSKTNYQELTAKITTMETNTNLNIQAIRTDLQKNAAELKTSTKNIAALTTFTLKSPMSTEVFDWIIKVKKLPISTGKTFNGTYVSTIKSQVSSAGYPNVYTVIIFVNHLDEAINGFTIHDETNMIYHPAPQSIPPHTEEIFTFAGRVDNHCVHTSFSYVIPSSDVRIAVISRDGTHGAGLAFVSKSTSMSAYYWSKVGIAGSSESVNDDLNVDRNLSVRYQNFYARMFADSEGVRRAVVRIELIELP